MKMKLRKFVLWIAMPLFTLNAYAEGGSSGAGGDGVVIQGQTYLLDLVEGNIHTRPFFKNRAVFSSAVAQAIDRHTSVGAEVSQLVAAKLYEVFDKNVVLEFLLKRRIFSMEWAIVPANLINIPDEDGVIEFPGGALVQLAVRQGSSVFIAKDYWDQLDVENRAALLFHEILYSLSDSFTKNKHLSPSARTLTRALFGTGFASINPEHLTFILNRELFPFGPPNTALGNNLLFVKRDMGFKLKQGDIFYNVYPLGNAWAETMVEEFTDPSVPFLNIVPKTYSPLWETWEQAKVILAQIIADQHPTYRLYNRDDIF